MKKIFAFLFVLNTAQLFAQTYHPGKFDKPLDHAGAAGMLTLVADKYIMELNETNTITLRINWNNSQDETDLVPQQYDFNFMDPATAPWRITKWEIIEGGGELKEGPGHYYVSYVSPATMPRNKIVTIAVTLIPLEPGYPKTQLLQTLYIEDNNNVFYYDCPAYGVFEEKYVVKADNGVLQSPKTNQANDNATPKQRTQINDLQKRLEEANALAKERTNNSGFDLAALTSNVKAIYAADKNVTTIQVQGKNVEMVKGQPSDRKRNYFITLSFPGRLAGKYKIKGNAETTATVSLFETQQVCACAFDPANDPKDNPPCAGGNIYITKYDNRRGGFIEGEVFANIQGAVDKNIIFGNLHGKFKVKLAN